MNREVPRQKDSRLGSLALRGFNFPLPLIIILNHAKANAIFFAFQWQCAVRVCAIRNVIIASLCRSNLSLRHLEDGPNDSLAVGSGEGPRR